jgi:hypothetical protein
MVGQCQAAVAEAVEAFGRIDVLLGNTSEGKLSVVQDCVLQASNMYNSCYWGSGRACSE